MPSLDAVSQTTLSTVDLAGSHPGGVSPKCVIIEIAQRTNDNDEVSCVLYGGQRLHRENTAAQLSGNNGRVYTYVLIGDSIPSGTQSWDVIVRGNSPKQAICKTLNSAAVGGVVEVSGTDNSTATPSITLPTGAGVECFVSAMLISGEGNPNNVTEDAGYTVDAEIDLGSYVINNVHRTENSTGGNVTVGWTVSTGDDDSAAVAIAIRDGTPKPTLYATQGEYLFEAQHTGDAAWTDVPGQLIVNQNFIPGNKYLVIARARANRSNTSGNKVGCRVVHGSTVFAESQWEANIPAATNSNTYYWFTVWSAVSGEALKMQFRTDVATEIVDLATVRFVVIDLSLLTENEDWFFNEDASDLLLDTNFNDGASVTFTPPEPGGFHLLLAAEQYTCDSADNSTSIQTQILLDGSSAIYAEQEARPDDQRMVPLMWLSNLDVNSTTVTVQASARAQDLHTRTHSSLFVLRMEAFEDFLAKWGIAEVDPVHQPEYGTTLLSGTLNVTNGGPFMFMAGVITDNHDRTDALGRHRIFMDSSEPISADTEDTNVPWDQTDEQSDVLTELFPGLSPGSHSLEQQVGDNPGGAGNGTVTMEDYTMLAFSLELADATPSPAKNWEIAPGLPVRSVFKIGPQF